VSRARRLAATPSSATFLPELQVLLHFAESPTGDIADADDLAQDKDVRAIGGAAS